MTPCKSLSELQTGTWSISRGDVVSKPPPTPLFLRALAVRVYVDVVNNAKHQGARMTLVSPVMGAGEQETSPSSQEGEKPPGKRRRKAAGN